MPCGCQASGLYALCSGRQKYGCGYPPSLARSQNTRFGISGNTKDKEQSFHAAAFVVTILYYDELNIFDKGLDFAMKYEGKYSAGLIAKMALIFFGLLFLVCVWLGRREHIKEEADGEKISCRDVEILLAALDIAVSDGTISKDTESYLTYGQYIAIYDEIGGEAMNLPDYADRYEPDFKMLKSDWYEAYRIMLAYLDPESSVWETAVFPLKVDVAAKELYTENGALSSSYSYQSPDFEENIFRDLRVYVKGKQLLTVIETIPGEHKLENVWVTESADGILDCFYRQTAFRVKSDQVVQRECVADLTFRDGSVAKTSEKNDKVHGKLLRVSSDEIEIEGNGIFPVAEGMEVYKLYGSLETLGRTDLKIGYEDTDYVVENDEICACLVSEKEAADRIRVLLKNTAENSNYYDTVDLVVDGETVHIEADDLETGERRIYRSAALTDKITVNVEGVTKDDNAYRGSIECYRSTDGIVLINELPLEEYLYAVVPSEMPASYPPEALKAQAVCARTYAYLYILHAGLPEVGAHVDDTTSYQVYHNSGENVATTTAVKETDGKLLVYQGKPAQNYYYSTSCGVGTDTGIWKTGNIEDTVYMKSSRLSLTAHISEIENGSSGDSGIDADVSNVTDELCDEDNFRMFITSVDENDLESSEPWYRWSYEVELTDTKSLLSRIKERYTVSPQSVLTKTDGDYYVSQPIESLGTIRNISVTQRGAGGVADELVIETDNGTYKILAEYNIRYVLCDRKSSVIRQDGSSVVPAALLPSGFFIIETGKNKGSVVGYTLIGGGYGHGVGMSQNGARALGQEGASYDEILMFFFTGCELQSIEAISDL